MVKHYAEFLYPGVICNSTFACEVFSREVQNIEIPKKCIGFRFFDRKVTIVDDEFSLGKKENMSGWYFQGEKMTLEQMKATLGNDRIYETMIFNMEVNKCNSVVKTRYGQFIALEPNDTVL